MTINGRCPVCSHMLEVEGCGNCHEYCEWCGYSDGVDGAYVPVWTDDDNWERMKVEIRKNEM